MASFKATGTLKEIFDTQQVSQSFSKREFVLTIQDGQYPQEVKFQAVQDRCDLLDNYGIGQQVEVDFNLRGRPSTKNGQTQYFTNLEAWKIQPVTNAPAAGGQAAARPAAAPIATDDDNDLPF